MVLKIISFNIWISGDIDEVKNFLQNVKTDVIGLQEIEGEDPKRDIVGFLSELGYEHVFSPVKKTWGGKIYSDGPAIFSRHEIMSSETYFLSKENPRVAIKADMKIKDKLLHVYSTHLIHDHQKDTGIQRDQAWELIKRINPNKPTIVMGDFNALPTSSTIKQMQKILVNTDPLSRPTWSLSPEGCGVCKPKDISMCLDYIFVSRDIKVKSFQVEKSKGSDHLAISTLVEI